MKQGWEIKPLGEICDSINGLWKGKKEPFVQVGVIRNTNFTKDCLLDISDIVYLDVEKKAYSKRSLTKGDIIIERSGGGPKQPVGRAVLFDIETGDFSFSNFTSILRLKNGIKISYYYLHKYLSYFYLSGKTECMQSNVIGIRNLDFDRYKNEVLVPFPSLLEQERIVGILDSAFAKIEALRANAQQNLQNTKNLFQASLKQELTPKQGWKSERFEEVLKLTSGDYLSSKNMLAGSYPVYGGNDIAGYHNEYNLDGENIIIGRVGALCGNTRYISQRIWLTDNAFKVSIKIHDFSFAFLTYQLNYINLRQYARQTAQPVISNSSLKDIIVLIPPMKEQQVIVKKLDALSERCRAMEENYRQTIAHCNALKQTLLTKAFKGEL